MTDAPLFPAPIPAGTPSPDVARTVFSKEAVWLPKLAAETLNAGHPTIKGKTFTDCLIEGPAIIMAMSGVSFDGCHMGVAKAPENLLVAPVGGVVTGVIGFEDCSFERCRFVLVGFTGDAKFREQFLATVPASAGLAK